VSQFVDKEVGVCDNLIDDSNLVEVSAPWRANNESGLAIVERGPLQRFKRGRACVKGLVVHTGCTDGSRICLDWGFNYGIRIREVIR
jgi:hypothetical protein